jgi:hypothetical protein
MNIEAVFISETMALVSELVYSFRTFVSRLSLLQLTLLLTRVLFMVYERSCLIAEESEALPRYGTGCKGNGSDFLVRIYCTFRIQIEFRSFDLGPEQIPRASWLSHLLP